MAVPNVTYNIDVKSKFALFLDDDLCEAEPDELVRRVNEDKKRREKEVKEAKRKEKQNKTRSGDVQTRDEKSSKSMGESGVKGVEVGCKIEAGVGGKAENSSKRETKTTESAAKPPVKVDSAHKTTERSHAKTEHTSKSYVKTESSSHNDDETSDEKNRSNKNKKPFSNAPKIRGREFDRHSGSDKTGVKAVERRDGSGSYNWGNVMDAVELPTFSEQKEDVTEEKTNVTTNEVGEKKEPEKPVMTISEWKALQSNDNIICSHIPTRPANNGENVFTGMNAYQKKNIHQNESDNEVLIPEDDTDAKGRRQIKVNIEFSGRARRGGRTGFTNPRFKKDDANKDSNKDGVIINLDEEEFPTLS